MRGCLSLYIFGLAPLPADNSVSFLTQFSSHFVDTFCMVLFQQEKVCFGAHGSSNKENKENNNLKILKTKTTTSDPGIYFETGAFVIIKIIAI